MDDHEVLGQISDLIAQEKSLRSRLAAGELSEAEEQHELAGLEVALDQAWDLLRQRRALREFGDNPDAASVRPASEVEGYQS